MKSELSIVRENVPGVQLEGVSLVFTAKMPVERLNALGRAINQMSESSPWWTGDIALEIQKQKCAEYMEAHPATEDDVPGEKDHAAEQFAGEYLSIRSVEDCINHGWRKNCMMVCRFYDPSFRDDGLTFYHHVAAMMGAGGAKGKKAVAQAWLVKAKKHHWSAADLRREVNLALATHTPPKNEPEENPFKPLDDADEWAMKHKDDQLTRDSAAKLLTRFEALIKYFRRLEEISKP